METVAAWKNETRRKTVGKKRRAGAAYGFAVKGGCLLLQDFVEHLDIIILEDVGDHAKYFDVETELKEGVYDRAEYELQGENLLVL